MYIKQDELVKQGIRICFIGDRSTFPGSIYQPCKDIEQATEQGTTLHVHIMICYGAQQEIVDASKRITHDVLNGQLDLQTLDAQSFAGYLWTCDVPSPDLIIRTGGVQRLSNFLLYQAAYAELYFLPCLWPALTKEDLEKAYNYFISCKRNFGQ
jgi:undecaprenyl diphosphate synthase